MSTIAERARERERGGGGGTRVAREWHMVVREWNMVVRGRHGPGGAHRACDVPKPLRGTKQPRPRSRHTRHSAYLVWLIRWVPSWRTTSRSCASRCGNGVAERGSDRCGAAHRAHGQCTANVTAQSQHGHGMGAAQPQPQHSHGAPTCSTVMVDGSVRCSPSSTASEPSSAAVTSGDCLQRAKCVPEHRQAHSYRTFTAHSQSQHSHSTVTVRASKRRNAATPKTCAVPSPHRPTVPPSHQPHRPAVPPPHRPTSHRPTRPTSHRPFPAAAFARFLARGVRGRRTRTGQRDRVRGAPAPASERASTPCGARKAHQSHALPDRVAVGLGAPLLQQVARRHVLVQQHRLDACRGMRQGAAVE